MLGAVSLAWGFRARRRALALGAVTFALGAVTLAPAAPPSSGRFSRRDVATHATLEGRDPRPGGARCEKPSVLVAGGQNRRFFAVSEVGNGRFCRLFAFGLSDGANNRQF